MTQAYTGGFQPAALLPARVNWFDPFAAAQTQPRSASIAGDAGASIETVTVEASRLPNWWVLGGMVAAGVVLWRYLR